MPNTSPVSRRRIKRAYSPFGEKFRWLRLNPSPDSSEFTRKELRDRMRSTQLTNTGAVKDMASSRMGQLRNQRPDQSKQQLAKKMAAQVTRMLRNSPTTNA